MIRESWIIVNGKLYEKGKEPRREVHGRSANVISDYTEKPLLHPVTGKVHESKSTFRRDTKNSGCIELGNDAPRHSKKYESKLPDIRQDLSMNWERLSNR